MACQKSLSILHLMNFLCIIFYNMHIQKKGKKEVNDHIILSEAWLLNHKGLPPSETFAPLLLKFGLKTKEACITIDFAP